MTGEAYITRHFKGEAPEKEAVLGLSLLIAQDTLVYAISTSGFKTIAELCEIQLNEANLPSHDLKERLEFLLNDHRLLHKKFDRVNVAVLNSSFVLAPQAFAGDGTKALLNFATGDDLLKTPFKHTIKNMAFCFGMEQELGNYLEKTFANASIRHSGAVNVSLLFGQHSLAGTNLLLVIGRSAIELAAKNGSDLLFYNVFNYESNEDVLYYLLFMMEQFDLDPLTVKLSIACQRPADDELLKSIRKYIKLVSFCVNDTALQLKGDLASLPSHYYFTLLNQHLCEL